MERSILTHFRTGLSEVIIIHHKHLIYCGKCFKQQKRYPGEENPLQAGGHSPAAAICPGYRDSHSLLLWLWCRWIHWPIFWCRFLTRRQLSDSSSSGWIRVTEGTGKRQLGIATAFTLWKPNKRVIWNTMKRSVLQLDIKWCLHFGFLIMEAKILSLSTGGHCSIEEIMCFKTTFQKIMTLCRNEEGLGGSEGSRAPIIHYWSGTLSFLSAGSVTTLYSPAKGWANLYIGRFCGLRYVPNVPFLSMPIFLQYLNWFLKCVTECLRR